jgi:parvulin-like peptidyl-prolyl isomerase
MKDNKGELGSFKAGELDKTLESAVEKLKPGERSAWVSLKNGWYLLELVKRTESRLRGFEDVRKEVEERLFNEKRAAKGEEYLKTLRERSFVKILKPNPLDF